MGRIWQTLRQPRTAHEKRHASDPLVRSARSAHRLPSSWDDIKRSYEKDLESLPSDPIPTVHVSGAHASRPCWRV
jgi:hypothetical protein